MRAIAGIGLVCAVLCVQGASAAAEKFDPTGRKVCDGEIVIYANTPFRHIPVRDITLEARMTDVTIAGDGRINGSYVINPAETSPIQVFFSGARQRFGSLRNDGKVRLSMRQNETNMVWTFDLNCRDAP